MCIRDREELDDSYVINLNSDNNAILIGKMGKTLAAFNTVLRAAVNAEFEKRIDVLIDINHYKEERYYKIRSMAKRIAKQVQRSKVDVDVYKRQVKNTSPAGIIVTSSIFSTVFCVVTSKKRIDSTSVSKNSIRIGAS